VKISLPPCLLMIVGASCATANFSRSSEYMSLLNLLMSTSLFSSLPSFFEPSWPCHLTVARRRCRLEGSWTHASFPKGFDSFLGSCANPKDLLLLRSVAERKGKPQQHPQNICMARGKESAPSAPLLAQLVARRGQCGISFPTPIFFSKKILQLEKYTRPKYKYIRN